MGERTNNNRWERKGIGGNFYLKEKAPRRRSKLKRVLKDPNNANGSRFYHVLNLHKGIHNFCGHCRRELNKNTLRWE